MTLPVTVIIVTHFSALDLDRCLASLPSASSEDFSVIVIDNATTDDSVRDVVARYSEVHFVEAEQNLGFGTAVNRAADHLDASCEWILVANPDTVFTPGSIDRMLASAVADDLTGSLGPRIENEDGSVYFSARALPSLRTGVGHALFAKIWPDNPWSRQYYLSDQTQGQIDHSVRVGWLSGACLLVRREAFERVGGFDEKYFMYFEDVDLGQRLQNAGWKNMYEPRALIQHAGGTSTARYPKAMLTMHHKSAYTYISKRYPHWYLWPVRFMLRLGLSARLWIMTRKSS